jgi:hypothetical protein
MPIPKLDSHGTVLAFTLISIPFVFGGVVVCVGADSFFRNPLEALYAADLAGLGGRRVFWTIPIL